MKVHNFKAVCRISALERSISERFCGTWNRMIVIMRLYIVLCRISSDSFLPAKYICKKF